VNLTRTVAGHAPAAVKAASLVPINRLVDIDHRAIEIIMSQIDASNRVGELMAIRSNGSPV
jgi:hypothetical protein